MVTAPRERTGPASRRVAVVAPTVELRRRLRETVEAEPGTVVVAVATCPDVLVGKLVRVPVDLVVAAAVPLPDELALPGAGTVIPVVRVDPDDPGAAPSGTGLAGDGIPAGRRVRTGPVVVAASTGGPPVLEALLRSLGPRVAAPVLVVQHTAGGFAERLARSLSQRTGGSVRVPRGGEEAVPGEVWLAGRGRHLTVRRRGARCFLELTDEPDGNGCRPAADVLFTAAAREFGPEVVAVVLTGLGRDGAAGAVAVRRAGGTVVVQDPATCPAGGMPSAVLREGAADLVVPPDRLGVVVRGLLDQGSSRHPDDRAREGDGSAGTPASAGGSR